MRLFTMGFSKKTAEMFFDLLETNEIDALIDVRLNNRSQLAGFTKASDLSFFLDRILGIDYFYEPDFAPTKSLLKKWRDGEICWDEYVLEFDGIMDARKIDEVYAEKYSHLKRPLFLCSEPTPEHCHRRLIAERVLSSLGDNRDCDIVHL